MEYAADERFLGTATVANMAKPMSPLQSALNEQGDQLDKLRALIDQVRERTSSLRPPVPEHDPNEGVAMEGGRSEVVNQISMNTSRIKLFQANLSSLLSELEV